MFVRGIVAGGLVLLVTGCGKTLPMVEAPQEWATWNVPKSEWTVQVPPEWQLDYDFTDLWFDGNTTDHPMMCVVVGRSSATLERIRTDLKEAEPEELQFISQQSGKLGNWLTFTMYRVAPSPAQKQASGGEAFPHEVWFVERDNEVVMVDFMTAFEVTEAQRQCMNAILCSLEWVEGSSEDPTIKHW